jgi:ribulose-phosphate 3-epimerase
MLKTGRSEVIVAPSILSADFGNLDAAVDAVSSDADWIHVDVMDGHFVPNLTVGPPVVAALRRHSQMFLDCHLMITDPARYLEAFRDAGASSCTVHVEVGETESLIERARELRLGVGLALNPETPVDAVLPYVSQVDVVLVMTVHPGFGGQKFIAEVLPKIESVARAIKSSHSSAILEVDGGIDATTAALASAAGARAFVAGTAVFSRPDPGSACRELREAASLAAAVA